MANIQNPNFQQLLDQYSNDLKFVELLNSSQTNEDLLYEIKTNKGNYYIIEIDYISSFNWVVDSLRIFANSDIEFIKVKQSFDNFEDYPPNKHTLIHKTPTDFPEFKQYLGYAGSSKAYYFNFLAKKKPKEATQPLA